MNRFIWLGVFLILALIAPFFVYSVTLMKILVFAMFAASFNLLLGYTGLLSFGHAMFFGTAAYITGHILKTTGVSLEIALIGGTSVSAVMGFLVGLIAVRRAGIQFAMITFAIAQFVYFLLLQSEFTGGEDGMQRIPRTEVFGFINLSDNFHFYYFVLAVTVLTVAGIYRIVFSPFGEVLKAIRDNEERVESLGFKPDRYKLLAMTLSAGIAGLAGGLKATVFQFATLEATATEAAGRITHGCLGLYNDAHETALASLVAEARKLSDAALGIQLGHAGRRASCRSIRDRNQGESLPPEEGAWQTLGPSACGYDGTWHVPKEMDVSDIQRVVHSFGEAAQRAKRAGFDCVEIHAAHGYLIHQFLSPITNLRTDDYGGPFENRMRFAMEVVRTVRNVWPANKALGVRVNSTDWHPDGLNIEDAVMFVQQLEKAGVDYVVMSAGNLAPGSKIPPATPGHQVAFASEIKRRTGLVSMAVGLIATPELADQIIEEEQADLVAIGRGMLDDPRWGLHAAARLGVDVEYPPQYLRARPNNWLCYPLVHPGARPIEATLQVDRPASSAGWDRPVMHKPPA